MSTVYSFLILFTLFGSGSAQLFPDIFNFSQYKLYADFFVKIGQQERYNTLTLLRAPLTKDCFPRSIMHIANIPILNLSTENRINLKLSFNKLMLVLVCMQEAYDAELLNTLASNFDQMRDVRVIFQARSMAQPQQLLEALKKFCEQRKFLNALVLFDEFGINGAFYQYNAFPQADMLAKNYYTAGLIFPEQLLNLRGKALMLLPDQYAPRTVLYHDRQGQQQLGGYVAQLVLTFIAKHNGTYAFPYNVTVGETIHTIDLRNLTWEGKLDFALTVYSPLYVDGYQRLSYPIEHSKWVVMVPTAPYMSTQYIFNVILSAGVLNFTLCLILLFQVLHTLMRYIFVHHFQRRLGFRFQFTDMLVDARIFPAVLGQASVPPSTSTLSLQLLSVFIFVFGLMLSTLLVAHLKTLLTSNPSLPEINSMQDMRCAPVKFLMDVKEIELMEAKGPANFLAQHSDLIEYSSSEDFQEHRINMDRSYAYAITGSLWRMLERQQRYYQRKVFRAPASLHLIETHMLGIPMPHNSIYKPHFDHLLHQIHEAGLMEYWEEATFDVMVRLGRISIADISQVDTFHSFAVADLQIVWVSYWFCVAISLLAFCVELSVDRLARACRKLKLWRKK